jgi:GTP-binding protein EngB required for normal cell division
MPDISAISSKGHDGNEDSALQQLLSTDQGELLDIIDKLREFGISGHINDLPLPQIICCGDQSSGKSSVLEAISLRSFPKGEGTCTTFATKLSLRRSSTPSVSVSIIPSTNRTYESQSIISNFKPKANVAEDFGAVVMEAKKFLLENIEPAGKSTGATYLQDVLHVSVNNPTLPPLTLVDLPGIIHSTTKRHTTRDIQDVRTVVESFMEDPNSIILAIMSAENDLQNQEIPEMIKRVDPNGQRTLGIITKPDTLTAGQKREQDFINCAKNEEYPYELGWHVVKNQGPGQITNLKDREKEENEFFSTGVWKNVVKQNQLGIAALRQRLSTLLEQRTRPALHKIIETIQSSLHSNRIELAKLGRSRIESGQQRLYLSELSEKFKEILEQATYGIYREQSFFGHATAIIDPKRLRAAISNLNDDFARTMRERGHYETVLSNMTENMYRQFLLKQSTSSSPSRFSVEPPVPIFRSDYLSRVDDLCRKHGGSPLPGLPNHMIIPILFQEQSMKWKTIATEHIDIIRNLLQANLELVASHVASPETALAISRHLIADEVDRRYTSAMRKLEEIMKPYQREMIINLDEDFLREIQDLHNPIILDTEVIVERDIDNSIGGKQQQPPISDRMASKVFVNGETNSTSDPSSTSSFMLDYMLAYYKVCP